jgi:hypothetical protein
MISLLERRKAIMNKPVGGDNVLYHIENVTFDGSFYIDTDLQLMNIGDFEMVIKLTTPQVSSGMVFCACRMAESPYYGFDIRTSSSTIDVVVGNSDTYMGQVSAGATREITIKRTGNTMTVSNGTNTYNRTCNSTTEKFVIAARSTHLGVTAYILNSLIIKKG